MSEKTLQELEQENAKLQHQLDVCVRFMRREVESSVHKISKRKVTQMTET
jgi:hypothetical protein